MTEDEAIKRLQSYLDDYGHTASVREQYATFAKRPRVAKWRWRRQQVKTVVENARRCGVLPTSWLAWMVIKLAVEAFLRRYLFSESGANQ